MNNSINLVIEPREKDIGITVRRILPWAKKRMVGPFIFLDHMGPAELHPPEGMDVRPHPHIGLSTLTYLLEGSMFHRDSLGYTQEILPGAVNWMTAGKGISHSERETPEARAHDRTLHGLQFWVALPLSEEDREPSFVHYPDETIPHLSTPTADIHLVAGAAGNKVSPLKAYSPMTFMVLKASAQGTFHHRPEAREELALYVVKGKVQVNEKSLSEGQLQVFAQGSLIEFTYSSDAIVAIIGGEPLAEERFIWWNFVSSSKEKIEAAKRAWQEGTFPMVPGETEFIPLPEK